MIQENKRQNEEKSILLKNSTLSKGEKIRKARNSEKRNIKREEKESIEISNSKATKKPKK